MNLLKVVEQLTEIVTKFEMQPLHTKGFMISSSQNVSNPFGNLLTSFQVKADIDIGKFSGTEPTLSDELNGALMSSHTKPVTLIASYCLLSGNQLLAKPNQSSDIWDHLILSMRS